MQGLISFNKIFESGLLKIRIADSIPVELQEPINFKMKSQVSSKGVLRKLGSHARHYSMDASEKVESQLRTIQDNWQIISKDSKVVEQETLYLI